ncbi:acetamidase/formamidase family protein [Pirellulales bacterium]|nr:acetamidase/formamidase family protein [Pirellulales bacterium]
MANRVFFSERFQYTYGPHEPTLRIDSGETIEVVCPDADNRLADGSLLSAEQRQRPEGAPLFEGNPLAGPIYVADVCPTDCLAVDILAIDLDEPEGVTLLAPRHGLLSAEELTPDSDGSASEAPRHMYRWRIDQQAKVAEMENPLGGEHLSVPLRPMIGSLGVCPAWGQHISSLFAGDFGGNLDLPIIEAGATVILPVIHPGGMLFLGDLHAAQGHGEIVGGGIEVSGKVTIRVRKISDNVIPAPRILSRNRMSAVATAGDLRLAISLAYSRLLAWIASSDRINRWDAYQLVSQAGIVEIGGLVVRSCFNVAAGISLELLPTALQQEINGWRGSAAQ